MNPQQSFRMAFGVTSGCVPDAFQTVALDGVAMAIWDRPRPAGFAAWIDALPEPCLPRLHCPTGADAVAGPLLRAFAAAGLPRCPGRDWLLADIALLAAAFAALTGQPLLSLHLGAGRGEPEPRFDMSRQRARLVCTYRGPGTEYGAARPSGDPLSPSRLPTGSAAVFRGAMWPGREFPGILHRAPPAGPGDEVRLLLSLDPVDSVGGSC